MQKYLNQNSKLKKDKIFKFSLPVIKTCIGASACIDYCYGKKGAYIAYKKKIDIAHDRNYKFSLTNKFVITIGTEILNSNIKIVRIHDVGDFYSQEYLDKWTEIAASLPHVRFYAYTKSLQLDFTAFTSLENTKIIKSYGGKYDHLIELSENRAVIFRDLFELLRCNFVDCSKSDLIALNTDSNNIGLLIH